MEPDFESTPEIPVTFAVTSESGSEYSLQLLIDIYDVNENPSDVTLSTPHVAENVEVGSVVGMLTGSDPDARQSLSFIKINEVGLN